MRKSLVLVVLLVGSLFLCTDALAVPFGFSNISNNLAGDAAIGETQLSVDVTVSNGNVSFYFTNVGLAASSITQVYFDDRETDRYLSNNFSINNGTGVTFLAFAPANNLKLPSANNADPDFVTTSYDITNNNKDGWLAAKSDSPTQPKGVNPGENLTITFQTAFTQDQIVTAMMDDFLRIGIHVQGFASGGSESFVSTPPAVPEPVPEPATMLLLGSGLVGLAGFGRRKFFKKA